MTQTTHGRVNKCAMAKSVMAGERSKSNLKAPRYQTLGKRLWRSPRFQRFRAEYAANGGNAYRAALVAGYSLAMAKGRSYELGKLLRQVSRTGVPTPPSCALALDRQPNLEISWLTAYGKRLENLPRFRL
jgi:hypothetical protein